MGLECTTFWKVATGAAPTRLFGLSSRTSSGKRFSIASLRRLSASYAASEISGASL